MRALGLILLCSTAFVEASGLVALDEQELGSINGRDGLAVDLSSLAGINADRLVWETDRNNAVPESCSGGSSEHGCTVLEGLSLTGIGGPLQAGATLDVGGNGSTAALAIGLNWQNSRSQLDRLTFVSDDWNPDALGRSFGAFAFDSVGHLNMSNTEGPLNSAGVASLDFLSNGDLFYRQGNAGSAELSLKELELMLAFSAGQIGADNSGLFIAAPSADMAVGFDLAFKASPTDFDRNGRDAIMQLDWRGSLENMRLSLNGGGAFGSEGMTLKAEWDFASDFAWTIGEASGDRNRAELFDWRRLGNATGPMLSMPVTFDLVKPGMPLGLCLGGGGSGNLAAGPCAAAGGDFISSAVSRSALAAMIRDGRLHAFNQKTRFRAGSGGSAIDKTFDWALIYTLGKLDADIFLSPEGRGDGLTPSATNIGLRTDITLLAQSPGFWQAANSSDPLVRAGAGANWATNTHFLLGDTNVGGSGRQFGVGIVNADLLWLTRDFHIRLATGDSAYPELPAGLWLQTDNRAQYRFRGILGGADLDDMSQVTALGLMDLDINTDRFIFVFSPGSAVSGSFPARFDGLLDLDNASLSFAEVSNPQSAFRISGISGRVAWQDGSIGLASVGDGAALNISNRLLFGRSASFGGAVGGEPLIGTVSFGNENFGRLVLPAGQWKSDITMRIPGS